MSGAIPDSTGAEHEDARTLTDQPIGLSGSGTRVDAVAAHLRDEILRGTIAVGERLPSERVLAERLAVGRSSIREAFKKLEQWGLVSILHGGGATVQPIERASLDVLPHLIMLGGVPDPDLLRQLLMVHEITMVASVGLAVRNAIEDERAQARLLLERMKDPGQGDDAYHECIESLLELLANASRNLVLRLLRNSVRDLFTRGRPRGRHRGRPPRDLITECASEFMAALDARDESRAQSAVRRLQRAHHDHFLSRLEGRPAEHIFS